MIQWLYTGGPLTTPEEAHAARNGEREVLV